MKKALLIILTLGLCLSLASSTFAASIKVPKFACFTVTAYSLVMTIKAAGKVNTADGQVPFYTITGACLLTPITGSGYVVGSIFKFTLSTSFKSSGILFTFLFSGEWDLTAPRIVDADVGEITWRITADSIHDESIDALLWANCKTQHVE